MFDFVEVNSTFYEIPSENAARAWRKMVPPDFVFAVRCNRAVTHKYGFKPSAETHDLFTRMSRICRILGSEILHLQVSSPHQIKRRDVEIIRDFLSSVDLTGIRLALEARFPQNLLDSGLIAMMADHNIIHCTDLSKGERPAYHSDILYSRLFGKGAHNKYQPTDEELRRVDWLTSQEEYKRVYLSFHFIRMYKDAARMKIFKETGQFPTVTKTTGLHSLEEVLREDASFPSDKTTLVRDQGWKIIDLTQYERVKASRILKQLPEKDYHSVEEVVRTLQSLPSW